MGSQGQDVGACVQADRCKTAPVVLLQTQKAGDRPRQLGSLSKEFSQSKFSKLMANMRASDKSRQLQHATQRESLCLNHELPIPPITRNITPRALKRNLSSNAAYTACSLHLHLCGGDDLRYRTTSYLRWWESHLPAATAYAQANLVKCACISFSKHGKMLMHAPPPRHQPAVFILQCCKAHLVGLHHELAIRVLQHAVMQPPL
eukprot:1161424-Pelagomonas_calceolata.AAC.16